MIGAPQQIKDALESVRSTQGHNANRLDYLAWQIDQLQREIRLTTTHQTLPDPALWKGLPLPVAGAPAENAFPNSTMCRQDSFAEPYFPYWTAKIGAVPVYHRKLWEFVYICQSLWERRAIIPGARGLGFGVGEEPLTAFFASQDCKIVATDMDPDSAVGSGWIETAQHAAAKENLRMPRVCPDTLFDANVEFRPCDMNAIPDDLLDFDFCWSACAFEHLGSIDAGLRFVERSIDTLKPGGWAVHTTEFNLSSNEHTLSEGSTVLFRRRDFEELGARLTAQGHTVAPFDFEPGLAPLDRYFDLPPYRNEPHLKLALAGYGTTSFGIIVQKRADG